MFHDQPLLSPKRLAQAVIVYFWWMSLEESQGVTLAPLGCHLFYFRREVTRWRHGAGYFDSFEVCWRRHWADVFKKVGCS